MNFLKHFIYKNFKYDLINKFVYIQLKELPILKKIILNFGCKSTDIKILTTNLLALEIIAKQKGILTLSKRPNLRLKIKKGNPIGCKLILKKPFILKFLSKNTNEICTKIKNFNGLKFSKNVKKNNFSFSYVINNPFMFTDFEDNYYIFNNLAKLDITIVTLCKKQEEFIFFLKTLQLPSLKNH